MKRNLVGPVAILASVLMSVMAYPQLHESVPVHWNWRGEVDRYGSRLEATLVGPFLVAAIVALFAVVAAVRARRGLSSDSERDATGEKARETIECAAILLITAVHGFFLANAAGLFTEPRRGLSLLVAAFLLVAGNFIGQVRRNRFVGVRTPWTLASDEVWRRTHRLTARLMVLAGLLLVAATFMLSATMTTAAILALVLGSTVPPVIYSFVLSRRQKTSE